MEDTGRTMTVDYVFMTHRERFVRFADSYIHHPEAAEDIVSESFLHYWEQRNNLTEVNDIAMYILVMVKNRCLDYLRRERVWDGIAEEMLSDREWELDMRITGLEACNPETLLVHEVQDLIDEAFKQMPEKTKSIFVMNRYEWKSYQEIAQETGLSIKSVEYHISKALKILRQELKDYMPTFLFMFHFLNS